MFAHLVQDSGGELKQLAVSPPLTVYGGTFVNGSLCCFELETVCFSTISSPQTREGLLHFDLVTFKDGLCAVDNSTDDEIMLRSI